MRRFVPGQAPTSIIPPVIRPLPAARSVEYNGVCFIVRDHGGQKLSYFLL